MKHQCKIVINLNREITLERIEDALNKLCSSSTDSNPDFTIPVKAKFIGFSALASFIQLLITWRRLSTGKLIIGNNDVTEDDLESFVKRYYGFIATILAWDSGVVDSRHSNIKSKIRPYNLQLATILLSKNIDAASRGDSIIFPFFDHLDPDRGLLPIVYKNERLCNETEFFNLTDKLLEVAVKNNSVLQNKFKDLAIKLNPILFELFENTHKWARKSFNGRFQNPGYRSIYCRFFKVNNKNKNTYLNSKGLLTYFEGFAAKANVVIDSPINYLTFLEVSINDSGSGLVQRYRQQDLSDFSLEQEFRSLTECLMKHRTSHQEMGDAQGRGIGLHRTMELLDEKSGFFRIRSGRMNLYRNFLKNPFYNNDIPNYSLLDWSTDSANLTQHPKVEGTCITLIVPHFL